MHGSGKVILGLVVLLTAAFLYQSRHRDHFTGNDEHLEHFDGKIVYERRTYDPVLSDLFVRASRALRDGDAETAEVLYRKAISKYQNDESTYESLGACLVFQSRYPEANAEYQRALEMNPRSAEALYGLGCVAFEERRYGEARDFLIRALEIRESMSSAHRVLEFVYDSLREPAKAASHLKRTLELNPSIPPDDYVRKRLTELKQQANVFHA